VLVIALMLPALNQIIDRLLRHDPLLPEELLPRWRRALTATLRMLGRYCALSFAAWAGSIPLAAKFFICSARFRRPPTSSPCRWAHSR